MGLINKLGLIIRRKYHKVLPFPAYKNALYIVGAQKAGTTSLYSYLIQHPGFAASDEKEIHFFDREAVYKKGVKYYRSFFPFFTRGKVMIEATPKYLYCTKCAKRIKQYSNNAKIVVLLREPVSRAYSAYNMYRQWKDPERWIEDNRNVVNQDWIDFMGSHMERGEIPGIAEFLEYETDIINDNLNIEEPSLLRRGVYGPQIDRFVSEFGRDNVLIIFSDDLKSNPEVMVNQILMFVGLDTSVKIKYPMKHVREYTVDDTSREAIARYGESLFEQDREYLKKKYDLDVCW